jgi:hypothetical protein
VGGAEHNAHPVEEYKPAGQVLQDSDLLEENLPAGQTLQVADTAAEY